MTTTTVATAAEEPWSALPEAVRPPVMVTLADAEPIEIESICLRTDERLAADIDTEPLAGWLEQIGISIEEHLCDATLTLEMAATRESAAYLSGQTCWTGWTLESRATMSTSTAEETWEHPAVVHPVAQATADCPQRRDPVEYGWDEVPYDEALADALGIPVRLAMDLDHPEWSQAAELFAAGDDTAVTWLGWWLSDTPGVAVRVMKHLLVYDTAVPDDLAPLVPRLIVLLREAAHQDDARGLLSRITGIAEIPDQRYEDDWRTIQAAYWAWWVERPR